MSQRIRQLEDALKISHAAHSRDPHPLHSEELLAVKAGVDLLISEEDEEEDTEEAEPESEILQAIDALAISQGRDARLGGNTGVEVSIHPLCLSSIFNVGLPGIASRAPHCAVRNFV